MNRLTQIQSCGSVAPGAQYLAPLPGRTRGATGRLSLPQNSSPATHVPAAPASTLALIMPVVDTGL